MYIQCTCTVRTVVLKHFVTSVLPIFVALSLLLFLSSPSLFLLPLQRVCQDKVFPYIVFFAKGGGRTGTEPIRAYVLTFVIALACIAIG